MFALCRVLTALSANDLGDMSTCCGLPQQQRHEIADAEKTARAFFCASFLSLPKEKSKNALAHGAEKMGALGARRKRGLISPRRDKSKKIAHAGDFFMA